jgi:hypothetical protein
MFLISGLRPTTGVYISIFKVDLVGNKRLIELGYEMDITAFNLLLKLQIYSRNMKWCLRYDKYIICNFESHGLLQILRS